MTSRTSRLDLSDLLRIDVDAELRQLAARQLRAPQLALVELLRAACGRGASIVRIDRSRDRLRWRDDGAEISSEAVRALACALDVRQPGQQRQQAVHVLESTRGQGLLFCLSASPKEIQIACGTQLWCWRRGTGARPSTACWRAAGLDSPRLELRGLTTDRQAERRALIDHAAFAPARAQLNGRALPLATARMLGERLDTFWLGSTQVQIGIPLDGDLCRLSLLRSGVVQDVRAIPPQRGLVYELAIQGDSLRRLSRVIDDTRLMSTLEKHAGALLRSLATRFWQLAHQQQQRLQELIFARARHHGELDLCDHAGLFADLRSGATLSIAQLRSLAARQRLRAVDARDQRRTLPPGSSAVLALDAAQRRFLHDVAQIELLDVRWPRRRWLRPLARRIAVEDWLSDRLSLSAQILAPEQLQDDERWALQRLRDSLAKKVFVDAEGLRVTCVEMIKGRGLRAGSLATVLDQPTILLRRRHPLLRELIAAVSQDPELARLALPAVLGGHDGWRKTT